jgi:hypothetical protein
MLYDTAERLSRRNGWDGVDWYDVAEFEPWDLHDEPAPPQKMLAAPISALVPAPRKPEVTAPKLQGASVLLLDVENVISGKPNQMRHQLQAARAAAAAPCSREIAALSTVRANRPRLEALKLAKIQAVQVRYGPDSADKHLLKLAGRWAAQGAETFYVASGDHAFAKVAEYGRLVVIAREDLPVSRQLAAAADDIRYIARRASVTAAAA